MRNIKFKFMDDLPHTCEMEEDIVYVSFEDNVSKHLCMCGCGELIVTPISPVEWSLVYNGRYSLSPSIGNWQLPCKSHYFITDEKVEMSYQFTDSKIKAVQKRDNRDLEKQTKNFNGISSKEKNKTKIFFTFLINLIRKIFKKN